MRSKKDRESLLAPCARLKWSSSCAQLPDVVAGEPLMSSRGQILWGDRRQDRKVRLPRRT